MPVQVQVTITAPGGSISDLLNELKMALSNSGLTITPESQIQALEAALAECEQHTAEEIDRIKAMTAQLDAAEQPVNPNP